MTKTRVEKNQQREAMEETSPEDSGMLRKMVFVLGSLAYIFGLLTIDKDKKVLQSRKWTLVFLGN